ncbi:hypothetical protein BH23CHL8_BH23CHL8_28680 [soil metagenome]
MRPIRLATALITLMLASLVVAPSVGAFNEAVNTGTTADYQITDELASPGVNCLYKNPPGAQNDRLKTIRMRPFHAHAPFVTKSHVGYRFIVKRQTPPYTGAYKTVFKSSIIKGLANQTVPVFFPARTWTAPSFTNARFRLQIILYWYAKGSQTNVIGRARGLMEAYRHKLGGSAKTFVIGDVGNAGYCQPDYHGL